MKGVKILPVAVAFGLAVVVYEMLRAPVVIQTRVAAVQTPARSGGHEGDSKSAPRRVAPLGQAEGNETSQPSSVVPAKALTADTAQQLTRKSLKHTRYDPLLRLLGLTPAESDRFIELLMEQEDARADLQVAARDQNLPGNSPQVEELRNALYAPIVQQLRDLLGTEGYDAYIAYEKTSFYRQVYTSPLVVDFNAAAVPLSDFQFTQLTDVIAANDRPYQAAPTDVGKESSVDWTAVLAQSAAFLTPAQLAVIRAKAGHFVR